MKKTMDHVYKFIADNEGLKVQMPIAQIKEVMRIHADMMVLYPELAQAWVRYCGKRKKALGGKEKVLVVL